MKKQPDESIAWSKAFRDLLLKQDDPGPLIVLHFFYQHVSCWQGTDQMWATAEYTAQALGWSVSKVKRTKARLRTLGLVKSATSRNKAGRVLKHYVKLERSGRPNQKVTSVPVVPAASNERPNQKLTSHRVAEPPGGLVTHKCLRPDKECLGPGTSTGAVPAPSDEEEERADARPSSSSDEQEQEQDHEARLSAGEAKASTLWLKHELSANSTQVHHIVVELGCPVDYLDEIKVKAQQEVREGQRWQGLLLSMVEAYDADQYTALIAQREQAKRDWDAGEDDRRAASAATAEAQLRGRWARDKQWQEAKARILAEPPIEERFDAFLAKCQLRQMLLSGVAVDLLKLYTEGGFEALEGHCCWLGTFAQELWQEAQAALPSVPAEAHPTPPVQVYDSEAFLARLQTEVKAQG